MSTEPHLSRARALDRGLDSQSSSSYFRRVELLRSKGTTPLLTLKHLAVSSGTDWAHLRSIIRRTVMPYGRIRVPKKSGGYRDLLSPDEELLAVQRWILDNILADTPRHPDSFAYFRNVTTRQCAERHVGATWMLKADIHNYFPSITETQIYRAFRTLGLAKLLSFEMARLCTWPRDAIVSTPRFDQSALPYPRVPEGVLPQGAPTSGALANLATVKLDLSLANFARNREMVYTRYSDDITFSGSGKFARGRVSGLIPNVQRIIEQHGLQMHRKKTRVVPPGARKLVLGIMITDSGVGILPEQKRRIDLYIHSVARYGPAEFARHRRFESALAMINHVEGWLAYLWHIDPEWTSKRSSQWAHALSNHQVFSRALA